MGSFGTCYAPHIGAFWDTPHAKRPVFNTVIFGAGVASHWRDNIGITQSRHLLRIVEESKASHRGVGLLGRPGFFSSESTYKAPLEVGAPLRHSLPAYRPKIAGRCAATISKAGRLVASNLVASNLVAPMTPGLALQSAAPESRQRRRAKF